MGLVVKPVAAGLAVSPSGTRLLVANYENNSVSLVDLARYAVIAELDLRPGKIDPARAGIAGGEYPLAVAWSSDDHAFVTSQRDREVVLLAVGGGTLSVAKRIKTAGQPNKMIADRARARLYVACDNSDSVVVLDAATGDKRAEILTRAPQSLLSAVKDWKGANPNNLALSPDGRMLFVTNGGMNALAVVQLGADALEVSGNERSQESAYGAESESHVVGLVPTGWYPNAVAVSTDGTMLYVVNGKSNAGPNPRGCRDTRSSAEGANIACRMHGQYVWQLSKAGLLAMPMPDSPRLAQLTRQVAHNNNLDSGSAASRSAEVMTLLRRHIRHVIYVVKENRSYDQILGDLEIGNGDPKLALLPEPLTPNHHRLARQFVTLDDFYDSGETSGSGWNWTTAGRTTDFTEKAVPPTYAKRGLPYDFEGTNRNINVGLATLSERKAADPAMPGDEDILPGVADVAAPDSAEGEAGAGYLWDAALRAGLSVRNYGFYGAVDRYLSVHPNPVPLERNPFETKLAVFFPTKPSLMARSDPYYRGFDMKFPDYWRFKEWEREFDEYAAVGDLPNLLLVRLPHDHFGQFPGAIDKVNTVETQMADNDYALGLLVEKVAHSPFKDSTLIFVVEDDAQNGADHVDAHRSIAFVTGPFVKQGTLISDRFTTVNLLRTMEEVLGLNQLGLIDASAQPMTSVFDLAQAEWDYRAIVPDILRKTRLPIPRSGQRSGTEQQFCGIHRPRSMAYWQAAMQGQYFEEEDRLDTDRFNKALWTGLKGTGEATPSVDGRDLRQNRPTLLTAYRIKSGCPRATSDFPDEESVIEHRSAEG